MQTDSLNSYSVIFQSPSGISCEDSQCVELSESYANTLWLHLSPVQQFIIFRSSY